jgi:hypothetical protein
LVEAGYTGVDSFFRVTKGAVLSATYSPATMDTDRIESFGGHTRFGSALRPDEIAALYPLFAAGQLSSYYSGEVLAPIGGETLPG